MEKEKNAPKYPYLTEKERENIDKLVAQEEMLRVETLDFFSGLSTYDYILFVTEKELGERPETVFMFSDDVESKNFLMLGMTFTSTEDAFQDTESYFGNGISLLKKNSWEAWNIFLSEKGNLQEDTKKKIMEKLEKLSSPLPKLQNYIKQKIGKMLSHKLHTQIHEGEKLYMTGNHYLPGGEKGPDRVRLLGTIREIYVSNPKPPKGREDLTTDKIIHFPNIRSLLSSRRKAA